MGEYTEGELVVGEGVSYVYFIRCKVTGLIKIGVAIDPDHRFAGIACGCSVPLERVAVVRGARPLERALHVRFWAHREHGEWFRPGEDLLAFIAAKGRPWTGPGVGLEPYRATRDRAAEAAYNDIIELDRDNRRLRFEEVRRSTRRSDIIGLS